MDFASTILSAAKAAHVAGSLLLAICGHESADFTLNYAPHDHGSPSIGVCQIKEATARQLGFTGTVGQLMEPVTNAKYAGLYLAYQQERYGADNWCAMTSAYNAGSYTESKVLPGYPRNLRYVRNVQKKLDKSLKYRLACGPTNWVTTR